MFGKFSVLFCRLLTFSQTYDVGTQKNHLNETVLLSTQNIMLKPMGKKILTILGSKLCLS